MAPELLASSDRYPSADIFSLGLTLYETCISCTPQHREAVAAGSSPLPLEGPLWHILRDGEAPPPQDRAVALCTLIHACLHPITSERPSTESILALPELINITSMTGTDLLLESAPKMPAKVPLARATSFLESMNSIKRCSSLQLSEAGRDGLAQCPIDTLDDDRALTPTGPSNGSGTTTFWQPLPVRKWFVEKDKELGGLNLPSLESIIEPQSPVATPSSSIKAVRGGLDCTASTECSSPNTSKCNSSSSGTFLFSDRQLSYDTKNSSPTDNFVYANEGRSTRSQRPIEASLSFPLPGSASSSRRRDKSYNGGVEPARARSSSSLSSPTAADLVSANLICRSPFAPVTTGSSSSTTPSVMKYRYVDSDTSSSFAVPSSKSSISVGNVFCSVGLGGYCPGANYSGKQTESNFRTVSKSIRRAGETVSSGGERKHDKTG